MGASAVYLSQNIGLGAAHKPRNNSSRGAQQTDAARDDRDNLSIYAAEYEAWVKHKVIGDEQRLDLIEGLEALRKQEHVLDFKYTIAPQTAYTPVPALASGNFDLRQSAMSLQMIAA
jgi:hypothetical protein